MQQIQMEALDCANMTFDQVVAMLADDNLFTRKERQWLRRATAAINRLQDGNHYVVIPDLGLVLRGMLQKNGRQFIAISLDGEPADELVMLAFRASEAAEMLLIYTCLLSSASEYFRYCPDTGMEETCAVEYIIGLWVNDAYCAALNRSHQRPMGYVASVLEQSLAR